MVKQKLQKDEEKKVSKLLVDKKMPFIAQFYIGPIQLYQMFGIFPWSMILHLGLIITVSIMCLQMNSDMHTFAREQQIAFYKVFLDKNFDPDAQFIDRLKTFYDNNVTDEDGMSATIKRSMAFYFQINKYSDYDENFSADILNVLQDKMCEVINNEEQPILDENEEVIEYDETHYTNYTALAISCRDSDNKISSHRAAPIVEVKLRGNDVLE